MVRNHVAGAGAVSLLEHYTSFRSSFLHITHALPSSPKQAPWSPSCVTLNLGFSTWREHTNCPRMMASSGGRQLTYPVQAPPYQQPYQQLCLTSRSWVIRLEGPVYRARPPPSTEPMGNPDPRDPAIPSVSRCTDTCTVSVQTHLPGSQGTECVHFRAGERISGTTQSP